MNNVSIVIPTYNKLPRLSLVLASLTRQRYPVDRWELIIVDDGSTDGTPDYVRGLDVPFRLHCVFGPRSGRSAARNRGLAQCRSDLVIFIDDDVLLPPEYIEEHVKAQRQGPAVVHGRIVSLSALKFFEDPSKGVLYPQVEAPAGSAARLRSECITEQDVLENFDAKVRKHRRISAIESIIEKVLAAKAPGPPWLGFMGGNAAAPREWLIEAGGFDPSFGLHWGSEDLEFGYRLCRKGFPFCYSYGAVNYHMAHYRFHFDTEQASASRYFLDKHGDEGILLVTEFIAGELSSHQLLERFRETRSWKQTECSG